MVFEKSLLHDCRATINLNPHARSLIPNASISTLVHETLDGHDLVRGTLDGNDLIPVAGHEHLFIYHVADLRWKLFQSFGVFRSVLTEFSVVFFDALVDWNSGARSCLGDASLLPWLRED